MVVCMCGDVFLVEIRIDIMQIVLVFKFVLQIIGYLVQFNKVVVGVNVFVYELGIYQDGVLKYCEIYEIMWVQDVGWFQNKLVLGKYLGCNVFKFCLQELGIELESDEVINVVFVCFKELVDCKYEIFDEDLYVLVLDDLVVFEYEYYKFVYLCVCFEMGEMLYVEVIFNVGGVEKRGVVEGGGLVDVIFKVIECIVGSGVELFFYLVNVIIMGIDVQGEVIICLIKGGCIVNGNGVDMDIVIVLVCLYFNVLNKFYLVLDKVWVQGDI